MSANKVKKIRTQLSISQLGLAKLAGTSQQQIQRIESGKITTSLTLAKAICDALGKPLEVVFPAAAQELKGLRSELQQTRYLTDEALSKVSSSGIEADARQWWFKVILKGQQEPELYAINASEKRRLYSIVQDEKEGSTAQFIVFDTEDERIALNLSEVSYCHFSFDLPDTPSKIEAAMSDDGEENVYITMLGSGLVIQLRVAEDEPDDDDSSGQLGHIFFMMENDVDASDRFNIVDQNGEEAFIRAGSIAKLQVALWALGEGKDADSTESDNQRRPTTPA